MAGPGSPGPTYWNSTYGYATFADFSAAATPYLEDPPFWLRLSDLPLADELAAAYTDPFEVIGSYLSIKLSGEQQGLTLFKSNAIAANHPSQSPLNPENAMSTLIIPDAFQVTIMAEFAGHTIDNVVGVINASGSAAGAAAAVQSMWEQGSGPLTYLVPSYTMIGYKAVDIRTSTGSIVTLPSTSTGGLTAGTQVSARSSCALVSWNGTSRSRSTRGRLYFGPLAEAQIDSDGASIVSGDLSDIQDAFDAFIAQGVTQGYPLAVLSRKNSASTLVTQATVETTIATQRRRVRG